MRSSNRKNILAAAISVINREGITGVTFDAVAAEAGVTRGGMMYHFPSREALIKAINQELADQWRTSLELCVGQPVAETTAEQRYLAYARTSAQSATRAEMLYLLDAVNNPELIAPWDEVFKQWATPAPADLDDPAAMAVFIARLAADGLWVHGSLSSPPLSADVRKKIADALARMIQSVSA